jgi:hypothetical protein
MTAARNDLFRFAAAASGNVRIAGLSTAEDDFDLSGASLTSRTQPSIKALLSSGFRPHCATAA